MRALSLVLLAWTACACNGLTLTVVVENVSNTRGVVGVLVFDSSAGWPEATEHALRSMAVPAQTPVTELTLTDLPPGEYSLVVLHDENSNMKLERNWLGRPREQWGMSNNPRAFLSAPSFDSARFGLYGNARMNIHLR